VFAPIYWAWVGTTIQSNVRDMTGPAARLAVFAVALAGLFMALAVPHAYGDTALLYAVALATAEVQIDIARLVLSYGHLAFIAAIIAVAVGMQEAVALPGSRLGWGIVGLLFGGVALFRLAKRDAASPGGS
jgi:low temperature requirement protein LtrA